MIKGIIRKILDKFIKKEQLTPLGRWRIDYCIKKLDYKIDLSNEDHCGVCNQYITKIKDKKVTL